MDLTGWHVSVACDLYQVALTEDGSPFQAESYCLMLEDGNGNRFYHDKVWFTSREEWQEEPGAAAFQYFTDTRARDLVEAEALVAKIEKVGKINLKHWTPGTPCYWSNAYANNAAQYERDAPSPRPFVTFGSVAAGDRFVSHGKKFIKTNRPYPAVNRVISVRLSSGAIWTFKDSHVVELLGKEGGNE